MSSKGTPSSRDLFQLDPQITFLNHGSYGACPISVTKSQREIQDRMEAEPVRFFSRELGPLLDAARYELASFIGAEPDDLAFVTNATTGVNTVLRSLVWNPGDEILTTNQAYAACKNAIDFVAERFGLRVNVATIPFPIRDAAAASAAIIECVTPKTRLAMIDHVASVTGLVFPIRRIVRDLDALGVDTLVDGAHAPGMLSLDVSDIGAAYYTGNCHKWMCAPKGAAFLVVRQDRQSDIHPLVISHGRTMSVERRSRFRVEFDWQGTCDPSAVLAIPSAIRFLSSIVPGGHAALLKQNRSLALEARTLLLDRLSIEIPAPDDMIGSLAAIPLPLTRRAGHAGATSDPLSARLFDEHQIQVPISVWPCHPHRVLRVAAQIYNHLGEYRKLADVLVRELAAGQA